VKLFNLRSLFISIASRSFPNERSYLLQEGYRGAQWICLLRLLLLVLFYANNYINYLTHQIPTIFHIKINTIVGLWSIFALFCYWIVNIRQKYHYTYSYLSTTIDALFLSAIVIAGGNEITHIFVVYYLLIACCAISYREGLPLFAGIISSILYFLTTIINDSQTLGGISTREFTIRIVTMLCTAGVIEIAVKHGQEYLRKNFDQETRSVFVKDALIRYVGKDVADRVTQEACEPMANIKETVATVMMSDIRGFTAFANNTCSEEVIQTLNEYFTRMMDIVAKHGGITNKFFGDAMLITFQKKDKHSNHAERAVKAAIDMQLEMNEWNAKRVLEQKLPITIGIGITTGRLIFSDMGSFHRQEYAVIGDAVNIAKKMETIAKAGEIVISEETYILLSNRINTTPISIVNIKGISTQMRACCVVYDKQTATWNLSVEA